MNPIRSFKQVKKETSAYQPLEFVCINSPTITILKSTNIISAQALDFHRWLDNEKILHKEFYPQTALPINKIRWGSLVREIQSYTDSFQKHFYFFSLLGIQLMNMSWRPRTSSFPVWSMGMPTSTCDAAELTDITRAIAPIKGAIVMIKILKFSVDLSMRAEVYCHTVLIKRVLNLSAMMKSKVLHAQRWDLFYVWI